MAKTNHTTAAYDRFRGLTKPQIRALIEIDERAMHTTDVVKVMTIKAQYVNAGIPFTADRALHYARAAEAEKKHGVAGAWYSWWTTWELRDGDDQKQRKEELKAYFIRNGFLDALREHRCACSTDEWRKAANAALKDRHLSFDLDGIWAEEVRTILNTFVRFGDLRGIRLFLSRALQRVDQNDTLAVLAARALGRALTTRERERIARRLLRSDVNLNNAFAYIRKHQLRRLYRPLINAAVSCEWAGYAAVREWAETLGIPLRTSDIERCYRTFRYHTSTGTTNAVTAAEALAQRSKRWRSKLPEVYWWARNNQLGWGEAEGAEKYGKRCGKPLTPQELLDVARRVECEVADSIGWAVKRRKFCLDLATERIANAVSAPPNRPAKRAMAAA